MNKVKTHLMFQGKAGEAIALYASVFPDFLVKGSAANVTQVSFAGHELVIFDSPPVHDFTFTPAMSLFVEFDAIEKLEAAFASLSAGGKVMMPLGDYGFSKRFGWLADRFGVSWQLNLPS